MPSETKRSILDAAKRLLWRLGYESMSPKRLMSESGAGQGSLYHHFRGKRAVAAAALDEIERELSERLRDLSDPDIDSMEALRRFLTQPRRGALGCRFGRLVNETAFDDFVLRAPIERYFSTLEERLAERIRQAQEAARLEPGLDAEATASLLVAMVQGGYVLSRARRSDAPLSEACDAGWALLSAARPRLDVFPEPETAQ